jgi:proline dehydrogenase
VEQVVAEYLALIDLADGTAEPIQLGFDLSNVGLLISRTLVLDNVATILHAAAAKNMTVVLSMERSTFVDQIIDVFTELAPAHPNLGLTVQAHLHRTSGDLDRVTAYGAKIRLVKGVYREVSTVALPRGRQLDERYVDLAEGLLARGVALACGTHDAALLQKLDEREVLGRLIELEMLHGVRPDVLKHYRERGVPCRVAAVYGENWWLHFLHRLAEYPPNVLTALADLGRASPPQFGRDY